MSTDRDFIDYLVDQMREAGSVSFRKMFGEYALYCDGRVVALVCDNQLFVKPTQGGRAFIGEPTEAPAYSGARKSFLIGEGFEDREWIVELIRITAAEVPEPTPKGPKPEARRKSAG